MKDPQQLKRKRSEEPLASWSTEEVVAFFQDSDVFKDDDGLRATVVGRVQEQEIDGEALATMNESDIGARRTRAFRADARGSRGASRHREGAGRVQVRAAPQAVRAAGGS